jgi:hypothetical protein
MKKWLMGLLVLLAACASFQSPQPQMVGGLPAISMGDSVVVVNRRPAGLYNLHYGIWQDMIWCLGLDPATVPPPDYIPWFVADSIKTPEGFLAYGMTARDDNNISTGVVIEAPFYFMPAVISHEMIHVLAGAAADSHPSELFGNCTMPMPFDLPARTWR